MISVVICTYNRCASLRDTLRSIDRQVVEQAVVEVIVVDNNSSDQTKEVIQEVADGARWPIRYVFERRQGISYARNAGIQTARGEIIAFLDDDVIAEREWAQRVWNCFQETGADAMGGRIERLWRIERPGWLAEELNGPLIGQDLGPQRKRWDVPNRHMVGANMAFRREVFSRCGAFSEALGRRGEQLLGGEDREMFFRLTGAGCAVFYEPAAVVWHKVEAERLSKAYFRRWYWEIGQTLGHQIAWRWHYRLTIAPLWVWRQAIGAIVRYGASRLRPATQEAERFASEAWLRFHAGVLKERVSHWLPRGVAPQQCVFARS